jgi:predicted aminopeptidase
LSNAHLASIATYHDFVPGFRALLARERTFPRFYDAVRSLAAVSKESRHRQLTVLALQPPQITAHSGGTSTSNVSAAPIK